MKTPFSVCRPYFLFIICLALGSLWFTACSEDYVPKPKAYPRIIFPNHSYTKFEIPDCPFTFEYPVYGNIQKDSVRLLQEDESPCWMNINFSDFKAELYLSYREIDSKKTSLPKLINDAYTMNAKHVVKADFIEDSLFITPKNVSGVFYNVGGDAASSMQFFVTDSIRHFLWASFYVKATPNQDSIAPVTAFFNQDLQHLINSFEWKQ